MSSAKLNDKLDDNNVHVKELNKLFLGCARNGETFLDATGLRALCEKLNLISYADEIIDRILDGFRVVEFPEFKNRFVQLLPEIVDVSETNEEIEKIAATNLSKIDVKSRSKLSRQDIRLLCEITPELNRLSSLDVNSLFDQADTAASEYVTLSQFLREYKKQKRISQEVNFVSENYIPTINLFESIDPASSGSVQVQDLLQHWATCGISREHGLMVLKQTGQPYEGQVDTVALSGNLERQLGDLAAGPSASVVVRVALVSLHAFVDHLRCLVKEGSSRAEHLYKQLQIANQRRNLLIEELEQNQISLEQGYEVRIKESEERHKTKIVQMEERYIVEKKDLMRELEHVEEELSRFRQSESASRNRLQLLERQCGRMKEEASEMADTIQQLEQLNRQLRQELNKMMQSKTSDDSNSLVMWRHRVERLLAHNKRLREKIDELTRTSRKKPVLASSVEPLCTHWTNAFRGQIMAIRKRRCDRPNNDTLSEMESEPETIFVRTRKRRFLNVRERKKRYERIWKQILNCEILGGSSDGESGSGSFQKSLDVQKLKALVEKAKLKELKKLKEEHRRELDALKVSANQALNDALASQEKNLCEKFAEEKKQVTIELENEKNELERKFAKEKVKLITRLQEEFNQELSRVKQSAFASVAYSDAHTYKRQTEVFESSLQSKHNGYDEKVLEVGAKYVKKFGSHRSSLPATESLDDSSTVLNEACDGLEDYMSKQFDNGCSTKSQTLQSTSFLKKEWNLGQCGRCELIDRKLKQIQSSIVCDGNLTESGIEDVGSSADSSLEEKARLKQENKKLKNRLDSFKAKIVDLRSALSLQNGHFNRYLGIMGGSECSNLGPRRNYCQPLILTESRAGPHWQYLAVLINQLEVENVLLKARLTEKNEIIKYVTAKYQEQLDETTRLGGLFQEILYHESQSAINSRSEM